jgi:mitofusin 2
LIPLHQNHADNLKVILGAAYALGSIPKSLPRRLSAKLSAELSRLDYTHANAARISNEVRRALRYPAGDLRVGLQRNVEKLQGQKEERDKLRTESEVARKYFGNLLRDSGEVRAAVERVDLEGPAPGVAAGYDF